MITKSKTKTKAFKITTIVCACFAVVMAVLMGVTMSGAWFTDTASNGTGTAIQFGTIDIQNSSIAVTADAVVMPGATIAIANPSYKGEAAYYRLSVSVSDYTPASGQPTLSELNAVLARNTTYGEIAKSASYAAFDISDITISPTTVGNTFQNVSCKLIVKLDVIQQANVDISSATGSSNAEKAFNVVGDIDFSTGL